MATTQEINAAYRKVLGRNADSSGLQTYANMTPEQIRNDLYKSEEGKRALVTKAYQEALYRTPDKGGMEAYLRFLNSGKSYQDLVADLRGSKEGYTADYRKMIRDWYSTKPATPETFKWTDEDEAAAKQSVTEEYQPYYQEQATQGGTDFQKTLQTAREGFSRRGLWGASAATTTTTDPETGLTTTNIGTQAPTGGPVSGLRQTGEADLAETQSRANTAYGRAFTEAIASGTQSRQSEAEDVYQKTIRDPYEQAYENWQNQLALYQNS